MARPSPLERNLQATAIRKFKAIRARDQSFVFRKRHGTAMGVTGDPDFYGLWRGVHWELELKARGKTPTKLQNTRREEWARAGAYCGVGAAVAEVEDFLSRLESYACVTGVTPGV